MGTDVCPAGMTADHSPTPVRGGSGYRCLSGLGGVIITNAQAWTRLHPTHVQFQADEALDGPGVTLNSSVSVVLHVCTAAALLSGVTGLETQSA